MMEDIRSGKVNCVVTKDLSRFGRNYIEVGKYIEKIFPYLGVRFIAINDQYDSIQNDISVNMMVPFKNLLNDAYCRDISIKIRSSLEVKRKKGDFVGAFAPYGYQKSKADKNKLEEDKEAAQVVRLIFQLYLQGNSAYQIAAKLNKKDVLTPMDYKKEKGSAFYTGFKKNLQSEWTHMHILRILKNPVYIGTLVQGRETTANYKVKKKKIKEQDQWNYIENVHHPIISSIDFYNVQKLLQMDTRTGTEGNVYCLSGMVICGNCGFHMVRKTVPSGQKRFVYYVCAAHKAKKEICSFHSVNVQILEECVLKVVNFQIEKMEGTEEVLFCKEKRYRRLEKLSREIVVGLVEKILVYKKQKGEQKVQIKLYLKIRGGEYGESKQKDSKGHRTGFRS